MAAKGPPKPPKRRSAEAVIAKKLGHRIKPSAKAYKRRPKHKKPRGDADGAFESRVLAGDPYSNRIWPSKGCGGTKAVVSSFFRAGVP